MDDYLELEGMIIQRIKDQAPAFKRVVGMADVESLLRRQVQDTPACFVVYDGDGSPSDHTVEQQYLVVPAARNVADTVGGADARSEAGPLMSAVLQALRHWRPGKCYREPVFRGARQPQFVGGYVTIPMAFSVQVAL